MLIKVSSRLHLPPNRVIRLANGLPCIVDPDLFSWLSQFPWRAIPSGNKFYAGFGKRIKGKYQLIRMHRLITYCPSWMIVHHINHNRLDNRLKNLMLVTKYEHRHFDGWHIFRDKKPETPAIQY